MEEKKSNMRICTKCRNLKDLSEFREKRSPLKIHISRICRDCENEYSRNYRISNSNKRKETTRNYRNKNKDTLKKYNQAYRDTHPEFKQHLKDYQKIYRNNDRVKSARVLCEQNRRAAKYLGGNISSDEWERLKHFYGDKCLCCGRSDVKLTVDHVVPLKLGGANTVDNVQPLCGSCNCKKHLKIIDYRDVYLENHSKDNTNKEFKC